MGPSVLAWKPGLQCPCRGIGGATVPLQTSGMGADFQLPTPQGTSGSTGRWFKSSVSGARHSG
jgi:hypothetical protein